VPREKTKQTRKAAHAEHKENCTGRKSPRRDSNESLGCLCHRNDFLAERQGVENKGALSKSSRETPDASERTARQRQTPLSNLKLERRECRRLSVGKGKKKEGQLVPEPRVRLAQSPRVIFRWKRQGLRNLGIAAQHKADRAGNKTCVPTGITAERRRDAEKREWTAHRTDTAAPDS